MKVKEKGKGEGERERESPTWRRRHGLMTLNRRQLKRMDILTEVEIVKINVHTMFVES